MNRKAISTILSVFFILSFVLAACAPKATPTEPPVAETAAPVVTEAPPAMPEADFAMMPGGFLERALTGEFSGTTVTVDGAMEGNDPDGVKMDRSVAQFEELTGINVNYIGNKEFEATISVRVEAGDAPDIVDFPQPGKMANFVRDGKVVDVTSWMTEEWLSQQYNQSWRDMATIEGVEAGVFHRFNGKSLVWYPKAAWDAAGYEIPETWDDLMALNQMIADDGDTAWCIGIESGAATGWTATDWTEEMMLRTTSLENYDAWVAGTLPFSSPEVKKAIETWSELWFNDDYVFGGRASIVSTFFGDSPAPMFEDPPKCWMHKQGNFITGFFPEGVEAGVDYGFFYFPPVDEAYGKPFLVAGDVMAMFNDRPEVKALMEYFTVPQSAVGWLEGGGALAAHQTATPDMYGVDLERGIAELVQEATSFRFDGSDLMPGEVGSGTFWEQISSYVAGSIDLDTATQEIDASWPKGVSGPVSPPAAGEFLVGVVLPTRDEPRWIQDETRFKDAFAAAGYDVQILFSEGDSAKEKANVEALIAQGVKVIVICPQDATAAAAAASEARAAGVKVVSYDRLIRDTDAVDYYVTFDSIAVGEAQAQYLVDKASGSGNPLYLYAGAATDNNAFLFFEGAWNVLQPKIVDGTFVIKNSSEAIALQDKATLTRDEMSKIIGQVTTDWKFDVAKNLAEANLTATAAADKGDVFILAPNDGTSRAIADVFAADADVTSYVISGQDAEVASVQYIIDGKQSMTVLKDVRTLVADAIAAAIAYLEGGAPEQTNTYNNGVIDVPAKPSVVITVDKDNVVEAVIDSGYWDASEFTGLP